MSQLRVVGGAQRNSGRDVGTLSFANLSGSSCYLTGYPVLTPLDSSLHPVPVNESHGQAQWEINGQSQPQGWPFVVLRAQGKPASVRFTWSNWCHARPPAGMQATVPGDPAPLDIMGLDASTPPTCADSTQPTALTVGPFEPGG
jgi:hypothetical protein